MSLHQFASRLRQETDRRVLASHSLQAQLLASLLLILMILATALVGLAIAVPTLFGDQSQAVPRLEISALVTLILLFWWNWIGHTRSAIFLTLVLLTFAIVADALQRNEFHMDVLAYLIVPLILSSAFYNRRMSLAFATLIILTLLLHPLLGVEIKWERSVIHPVSFIVITSALIYVIDRHRQRLEAESRATLQKSEAQYRNLIMNLQAAILVHGPDGRIVLTNPSAETLFGLSNTELLGKAPNEGSCHFLREDGTVMPADEYPVNQVIASRQLLKSIVVGVQRDDSLQAQWCQVTAYPLFSEDSELEQVVVKFVDISERIRFEAALSESESRFRTIFESAPIGISIARGGITVQLNSRFLQMFGYQDAADIMGHPLIAQIAPEHRAEIAERAQRREHGESVPNEYETVGVRKDGTQFPFAANVARMNFAEGQATVGFFVDITARKRVEDSLQESEARYRSLFENSPVSLWEEDFSAVKSFIDTVKGAGTSDIRAYFRDNPNALVQCATLIKVTDVNQAALALTDAPNPELLSEGFEKLFTDQTYAVLLEEVIALAEGKTWFEAEAAGQTLQGNPITYIVKLSVVRGYEESWSKVFVAITDVTARRRAEAALRANEVRFGALIEHSADATLLIDRNGRIVYASPSASRVLGYESQAHLERNLFDWMHPDDARDATANFRRLLAEPGGVSPGQFRILHRDGSWRWIDGNATNLLAEPDVKAIVLNYRDITEQKRAEAALRESEERFSSSFNLSSAGIIISELSDGRIIDANPAFLALVGCKRDDVIGRTSLELQFLDLDTRNELVRQGEHTGSIANVEVLMRTKSGEKRCVLLSAGLVRLAGENRLLSTLVDITKRKRAEQELLRHVQVVEEMRLFLQTTLDAFAANTAVLDAEGTILTVNQSWIHFADSNQAQSPMHFLGENYLAICDTAQGPSSNEASWAAEGIRAVIRGLNDGFSLEYPCHSPSEQHWFSMRVTPFPEAAPRRVVIAHMNITERMQAQEVLVNAQAILEERVTERTAELNATKDRVEAILENSVDGILLVQPDLLIQRTNRAFDVLFACAPGGYINRELFSIVYHSDVDLFERRIQICLSKQAEQLVEVRAVRADRSVFDAEFSLGYASDNGLVCTVRDITERRRTQVLLKEQRDFLELVVNSVPDLITVKDREGRFQLVNLRAAEIYGIRPKAALGNPATDAEQDNLDLLHSPELEERAF